jgi:hypothetical protein
VVDMPLQRADMPLDAAAGCRSRPWLQKARRRGGSQPAPRLVATLVVLVMS